MYKKQKEEKELFLFRKMTRKKYPSSLSWQLHKSCSSTQANCETMSTLSQANFFKIYCYFVPKKYRL